MDFCLPVDFSMKTINTLQKLQQEFSNHRVVEVYGNISPAPILGSGRGWNIHQHHPHSVSELKEYLDILKDANIVFNYTLNTACTMNMELKSEGLKEILSFVEELMEAGIIRVTIANPVLIDILHRHFPELEITASVIGGINSVRRAKEISQMGANIIALHEDMTRNLKMISAIHKHVDVRLEIIVNSMCNFNCIYRRFHYNSLAHYYGDQEDTFIEYFNNKCSQKRSQNPVEYIKSPWIRPEDLRVYSDIGIGLFKIIGRERISKMDIDRLLRSYFSESYEGNLLDLIYGFYNPPNVFIDNKKLEGFIKYFIDSYNCTYICETGECQYCQNFARKAIHPNDFQNVVNPQLEDFYEFNVTSPLTKEDLVEGLS